MTATEEIQEVMKKLPEPLQEQVLRYARLLIDEVNRAAEASENQEWSRFSVASALRDLEDDVFPSYGEADLKERY